MNILDQLKALPSFRRFATLHEIAHSDGTSADCWIKRNGLLLLFAALLIVAISFVVFGPNEDPPWLSGAKGNAVGEIFGGVLFLILGFHLDRKADKQLEQLHSLAGVAAADRLEEMERKAIERFLHKESYTRVRLTNLTSTAQPLGLEVEIEPVRDENSKSPLVHTTEFEDFYVIKVVGPGRQGQSALEEYEKLALGSFYFCSFYSGSWHMGLRDDRNNWYAFRWSGKSSRGAMFALAADKFVMARKSS